EGGDPRAAQGGPLKKGGNKRTVRHSPLFSIYVCVEERSKSNLINFDYFLTRLVYHIFQEKSTPF
ncbi:MAG: hypothetical protein ACLVL7_08915, partial [Anaerotruncus massiliensis (ex Togo et al. 2019)]